MKTKILNQILNLVDSQKIRVIGIDGPTAAGKTIFTQFLKYELDNRGHKTWIFQMDWTLISRIERTSDLEHLKDSDYFLHEAERHMRLQKAQSFLTKIRSFNEQLRLNSELTEEIKLDNLYSREDGGRETGEASCLLQAGLIILVEGHYTLRTELDQLIDYNILMLAEKQELLTRKIARIKDYRDAVATEDYFYKIDVPSFSYHLIRFYQNADLVIENTDFLNPILQSTASGLLWLSSSDRQKEKLINNCLNVFTPTEFMLPPFLDKMKYNLVITGCKDKYISANEAFLCVLLSGGLWIHRFTLFEELNYFLRLAEQCNMSAVKIGNYLIASNTQGYLQERIQKFLTKWTSQVSSCDEAARDRVIIEERNAVETFVQEHCSSFVCLDGYLSCPSFSSDSIKELRMMLCSNIRLLRKKAFRFIQQKNPDLLIDVSTLWSDLADSNKQISLQTLAKISPSILSDVYLWLAIREQPSAVLATNIYDISDNSLDCRAYLTEAMLRQTPIVLQSSLNAIGQKEFDGDNEIWGYLKPKNGVETFTDSVMKAARDVVLEHDSLPLFAIGIDHVDYLGDVPMGRARRFVEQAIQTELVTHFVLDGSALFNAENRLPETLDKTFRDVLQYAIGLLPSNISPIMDFEFCFGELNYVENDGQAMLPKASEMIQVVKICCEILREAGLDAINAQPKLFIGNLGTTHHAADTHKIQSYLARTWVDETCRYGFVSAVLHGTTNTQSNILSEASDGCYKINVAGDLMHTLITNLPIEHQLEIQECCEPKKGLYLIRQKILADSVRDKIHDELAAHCGRLMDTIHTPIFSNNDLEYFQYPSFKFSDQQIDSILNSFTKSLDVKHAFSASMIEVPFNSEFVKMVRVLWDEGINNFHIDVGDGRMISRQIDVLDKVTHLRTNYPDSHLHAHFMVKNPHLNINGEPSYIDAYVQAGCNAIAVHENAFDNYYEFEIAINTIRKLGARPGIVVETTCSMSRIFNTIRDLEIDWIVVMGVPIGFGGQIFDLSTLNRIAELRNFSLKKEIPLLIEVDGGLTTDIMLECLFNGAQLFAGWSIIRGKDTEFRNKIQYVNNIISTRRL